MLQKRTALIVEVDLQTLLDVRSDNDTALTASTERWLSQYIHAGKTIAVSLSTQAVTFDVDRFHRRVFWCGNDTGSLGIRLLKRFDEPDCLRRELVATVDEISQVGEWRIFVFRDTEHFS